MAPKHDFIITDRTDITYEQFRIESSWVDRRLVLNNRDDIKGYHFYVREWEHYDECTYRTADVVDSLEM